MNIQCLYLTEIICDLGLSYAFRDFVLVNDTTRHNFIIPFWGSNKETQSPTQDLI
jgi:hypothetical protein